MTNMTTSSIHDYVVHQDASIFMWCLNMAKLQIEQTKHVFIMQMIKNKIFIVWKSLNYQQVACFDIYNKMEFFKKLMKFEHVNTIIKV